MPPSLEKPIKLWHLLLSVAVMVIGGVFTATMAWADVVHQGSDHEKRLNKVEMSSKRIEFYLVRIGQKIGADFDPER